MHIKSLIFICPIYRKQAQRHLDFHNSDTNLQHSSLLCDNIVFCNCNFHPLRCHINSFFPSPPMYFQKNTFASLIFVKRRKNNWFLLEVLVHHVTGRTLFGIILTYKLNNKSLSIGKCTIAPNWKSFSSCEFSDHLFALPCTNTWTATIKRRLLCDIVGRKWKSLLQLYFSTAKHGRATGRLQQKGEHKSEINFWRVLFNVDPSHTNISKPEPLKQLCY